MSRLIELIYILMASIVKLEFTLSFSSCSIKIKLKTFKHTFKIVQNNLSKIYSKLGICSSLLTFHMTVL